MKKIALFFVLSVLLPLQAQAVELWKEGEHYQVLDKPATKKPEIREYFSFWCPACFNFEPLVDQIKTQMPENVKFHKTHVNFMGFTGPEVQDDATRAMMIGQALKQSDAINRAIFNYIHRQRGVVTGIDDLRNIFLVNDVDPEQFDKLAKSFGVNNMVKRNNKQIADNREFLNGVPNFIVNGKYQATFTRDMTPDDMVNLIIWLTSKS
jgi:thiol:disulfide interchange protein DsbA